MKTKKPWCELIFRILVHKLIFCNINHNEASTIKVKTIAECIKIVAKTAGTVPSSAAQFLPTLDTLPAALKAIILWRTRESQIVLSLVGRAREIDLLQIFPHLPLTFSSSRSLPES